jgi:hypothetical protein
MNPLPVVKPDPPLPGDRNPRGIVNRGRKVRRNEPCPCGSGKKFKHCHLPETGPIVERKG